MFEHTSDDRMQLVGLGDLQHPGSCMVCGSGTRQEGYVNLGVYFDYEGNMYLCVICLTQAAEIIGMLTSEEVAMQRQISAEVAAENTILKAENERLAVLEDTLRSVVGSPALNAVFKRSLFDPAISGSEAGESEVKESATSEGRSDSNVDELRDVTAGGTSKKSSGPNL